MGQWAISGLVGGLACPLVGRRAARWPVCGFVGWLTASWEGFLACWVGLPAGGWVGLLWVVEIVDLSSGFQLDVYGILPRKVDGLMGIFWSPMLHADFAHLVKQ